MCCECDSDRKAVSDVEVCGEFVRLLEQISLDIVLQSIGILHRVCDKTMLRISRSPFIVLALSASDGLGSFVKHNNQGKTESIPATSCRRVDVFG
jgi:hypothetical protein